MVHLFTIMDSTQTTALSFGLRAPLRIHTMLSQQTVDQILALLKEDSLSQREIARRTGVSRGTVCAIANQRRKVRPVPARWDQLCLFTGPIVRCPRCGGRVYAPCRLCYIRDLKQAEADRALFAADAERFDQAEARGALGPAVASSSACTSDQTTGVTTTLSPSRK
jgi:DNA-binding XRE family transcriptional regulator